MELSSQEEILCALWAIAALLAFGFGYSAWGMVFSVKAGLDLLCVFRQARKEFAAEAKQEREQARARAALQWFGAKKP